MAALGGVRIGHQAPDFKCEAIIHGSFREVTLSSYITPSTPRWLIILFIPAAFSFVCPTEVLAFQNTLDEFEDRNCSVVFVSVDTKHSLWHWQNVPRQYGGLGSVDIPLLSDANHRMGRDYGVLIEDEGICLRGMFILDHQAIVQHVTLNNINVGRSVLEALRLLEAFQAVAKYGVLCPVDWRPSNTAADTLKTISHTLTESYEDRLANIQAEFGDVQVSDLDHLNARRPSHSVIDLIKEKEREKEERIQKEGQKEKEKEKERRENFISSVMKTATQPNKNTNSTTTPTPNQRKSSITVTARHARGHGTSNVPHLRREPSSPSYLQHTPKDTPLNFGTRDGGHVTLEFADPIGSPSLSSNHYSPLPTPTSPVLTSSVIKDSNKPTPSSPVLTSSAFKVGNIPRPSLSRSQSVNSVLLPPSQTTTPTAMTFSGLRSPPPSAAIKDTKTVNNVSSKNETVPAPAPEISPTQLRLQATLEAIKKMRAGLTTPKATDSQEVLDSSVAGGKETRNGTGVGYFDLPGGIGA